MRDSGLDISYALRKKRLPRSARPAESHRKRFEVGTYEELIPQGGSGG
ncbi:hypothetical protein ACLK19_25390 [Escherichia coli]